MIGAKMKVLSGALVLVLVFNLGCEKSIQKVRALFGRSVPAPVLNQEVFRTDDSNKLYLPVADAKSLYKFMGKCDLETKELLIRMTGFSASQVPNNTAPVSLEDWQVVAAVAQPGANLDCTRGEFEFSILLDKAGAQAKPESEFAIRARAPIGESDIMEVPVRKVPAMTVQTDALAIAQEPNRYSIVVLDAKPVQITALGGLPPYDYRLLTSNVAGLPKDGKFDCRSFSSACGEVGEKKVRIRIVDSIQQQQDILFDLLPAVVAKVYMPGSVSKVLYDSSAKNDGPLKIPAGTNIRIKAEFGMPFTLKNTDPYSYTAQGPGFFDPADKSLYRTQQVENLGEVDDQLTISDSRNNKAKIPVKITAPLRLVLQGNKVLKPGATLNLKAVGGKAPYTFSVDKINGKEIGEVKLNKSTPGEAVFKVKADVKDTVYPVIRVIDEFGSVDKTSQGSSQEVKVN
jgi:hypothetical protein